VVLKVPRFEGHRFQNVQAADWYTMNFFTRGTLDVGNAARTYLLAGPDWSGPSPPGVDEVVTADSWIIKLFTRIIVEGPGDEAAIHALQDRYALVPLSEFLGRAPPPAPPAAEFPAPPASGLRGRGFFEQPSPEFIGTFNSLMTQAAIHPDEAALFERFAGIGVAPGAAFDASALAPRPGRGDPGGDRRGTGPDRASAGQSRHAGQWLGLSAGPARRAGPPDRRSEGLSGPRGGRPVRHLGAGGLGGGLYGRRGRRRRRGSGRRRRDL
jgi:hypothetical protein